MPRGGKRKGAGRPGGSIPPEQMRGRRVVLKMSEVEETKLREQAAAAEMPLSRYVLKRCEIQ